jgi:hypothetical protein
MTIKSTDLRNRNILFEGKKIAYAGEGMTNKSGTVATSRQHYNTKTTWIIFEEDIIKETHS